MRQHLLNLIESKWVVTTSKVSWIIFLVCLPVTSFPFFPGGFGGGTLVRPLAVYPLLVLLVLVTMPRLINKPLPKAFLSFSPFLIFAVLSTILAHLNSIETSQNVSLIERTVRALVTLGIGSLFFITIVLWHRQKEDMDATLRWLYLGLGLALLWGSLQAIYVLHYSPQWFKLLNTAQRLFSIRKLFFNRVSGLTYEPNWFADQISFVYLPWLLAAVVTGKSAFRWRWHGLSVECFLLAWAIAILPFTYSRAGLGIMLVLVFSTIVLFLAKKGRVIERKSQLFFHYFFRMSAGLFLLVSILGAIYLAGSKNEFFTRLWSYWQRKPEYGWSQYLADYFEYVGFGARFTYWETAYRVYDSHPILGVGLGNYAYYFNEMLPERSLSTTPEVLRLVVPGEGRDRLVTPKNFALRLLAETGILGAAAFAAFFMAVIGGAIAMWFSPNPLVKYWGVAGLLGILAFLLVSFSFDSFALPNMWVVFGLIVSAEKVLHE